MKIIVLTTLFVLLPWVVGDSQAFEPTEYEEWGGLSFRVQRDLDGDVYGLSFQSGVWWVGTPVFGEISGGWLTDRLQDGDFSFVGFTLRWLPRTNWAPFVGVGGNYQSLVSDRERREDPLEHKPRSYWSGHAEAGLRIWFGEARHFLEGLYRQTWTERSGDFDYSWIAIAYGRLL